MTHRIYAVLVLTWAWHSIHAPEGCNRSFAELWRLKVHYRAPPDIRGSGKFTMSSCGWGRTGVWNGRAHVLLLHALQGRRGAMARS